MAYGFDLESGLSSSSEAEEEAEEDEENLTQKAMIPFADLFNADGDLNNVNPLFPLGNPISEISRRI